MISVILPTLNAQRDLVRALDPLVSGLAAGLIRQAIVADGGSSDDTVEMAEAAGCDVAAAGASLAARCAAGAEAARSEWLMFLSVETALAHDWKPAVERFLKRGDAARKAAAFTLGAEDGGGLGVKLSNARASLLKQPSFAHGLLIARALYQTSGGHNQDSRDPHAALLKRIGANNLVLLRSQAVLRGAG